VTSLSRASSRVTIDKGSLADENNREERLDLLLNPSSSITFDLGKRGHGGGMGLLSLSRGGASVALDRPDASLLLLGSHCNLLDDTDAARLNVMSNEDVEDYDEVYDDDLEAVEVQLVQPAAERSARKDYANDTRPLVWLRVVNCDYFVFKLFLRPPFVSWFFSIDADRSIVSFNYMGIICLQYIY